MYAWRVEASWQIRDGKPVEEQLTVVTATLAADEVRAAAIRAMVPEAAEAKVGEPVTFVVTSVEQLLGTVVVSDYVRRLTE